MWLHLMWPQLEVVQGPVGIVSDGFWAGFGDRTLNNLKLQPRVVATSIERQGSWRKISLIIESTSLEGDAAQLAHFAACGLHNGTVVVSEALKLLKLM